MQIFAIVLSLAVTVVAVYMTTQAVREMLKVLRQGTSVSRSNEPAARTVNMLKETFVHTRMLQWTWIGVLHWFAYAAFLILSTAVAQAFFQLFKADFAWPIIGHWVVYEWVSEFIGLLGALAIIPLAIYRQVKHPKRLGRKSRFFGSTMWQAYFVEAMVFLESSAILFIRAAEYKHADNASAWHFPISHLLSGMWPDSHSALENVIYAIAMIKIVSAMVWLIVISDNLTMGVAWHRFTAWPNIWFKREASGRTALGAVKPLTSAGKPITLDDIDDLDEDSTLGAGAIEDFSWKGILDFTTCTECGRCQSQCPAWNTEKPLSPKLMMMGLREHAYAKAGGSELEAERPLIGDTGDSWFYMPEDGSAVIDADALWSCTSCGACVQQCPVDIEHVDHIIDMRRYQLLVEANFPSELNQLFKGLENKGNPWNMAPTARLEWAQGLEFDVPVLGEDAENMDDFEWLFWVGCAGAYEDRAKKTTRAVAELLDMAGVKFAVLGNGETCTGDPARRAGNEFVFQGLAQQNVETFKEMKVKKVVSTCAHCFNTLKNEYKDFGIELEVVHHTQLLNRLVREKKLTPVASQGAQRSITYHDPCYLGRHNQVYSPPRELLQVIPDAKVVEMERNSERSFCCGAGGARMWMEETIGERININRTVEAVGTGADQIAVGCPFCRVMLADGLTATQAKGEAREEVEVLDVAQLLLASVKGEAYAPKKPEGGSGTPSAPAAPAVAAAAAAPAAPAEAPAAPAAGGSLFGDDAAEATAPGVGGSLFDAPAAEAPTAPAAGSLFDTPAPEAPAAPASAAGSSLFDLEAPAAEPAATAEPASAPTSDIGGGSLFDIAASEPAPTEAAPVAPAAPAAEAPAASTPAPAPATEIGSGSLFDIAAPEPAASPEPAAPTTASVPAAPDTPAAPEAETPAAAPATEIGSGSLFDIPAPEPAAPAAPVETATAHAPVEPPAPPVAPASTPPTPVTDIGSGSLFDIPAPEPAAPAAPTAASVPAAPETPAAPEAEAPAAAPATEIGSGSLFDFVAPEPPAPAATEPVEVAEPAVTGEVGPEVTPDESADLPTDEVSTEPDGELDEAPADEHVEEATEEAVVEVDDEFTEEPEAPAPASPAQAAPAGPAAPTSSGAAHQPATDKDINAAGSLFDL